MVRTMLCVAGAMLCAAAAQAAAPKAADTPVRISLGDLGFQTLSQNFLLSGSSMLSLDFVDDSHLLVTFGVRRLMKRDEVNPDLGVAEPDQDRVIGAYLLELPSGKVLAQTEWRLHDHGQYLWNLGRGRFLLRIRDHIAVIAPLHARDGSGAFQEFPFLNVDRRIVAILVSSERDLLTIETMDRPLPAAPAPTSGGGAAAAFAVARNPAPIQINFYRLAVDETGDRGLLVAASGVLRAREAIALPVTSGGYLDAKEAGRGHWKFQFDTHGGKQSDLAGFDSVCFPRTTFVSGSEFVAFGCRNGSDKQLLGGFNLRGEQMWQQNLFDYSAYPAFSFAPAAGRFALSRVILSNQAEAGTPNFASMVQSQEVRVYQTDTGKQVFKVDCSPVERAGENFALSPDGMRLAVVRETTERHAATKYDEAHSERTAQIEIYSLPALSAAEQIAVKEAREIVPAAGPEMIQLTTRTTPTPGTDAAAKAAPPAEATGPTAAVADSPAAVPVAVPAGGQALDNLQIGGADSPPAATSQTVGDPTPAGDAEPSGPRKPPTLYGPGETPAKPQ